MNNDLEIVIQQLDDLAHDPMLGEYWHEFFAKMRDRAQRGTDVMLEEIADLREQAYRGGEFPGDFVGRWDE